MTLAMIVRVTNLIGENYNFTVSHQKLSQARHLPETSTWKQISGNFLKKSWVSF